MNDLNKEHEINRYLIEEEKNVKLKMAHQGMEIRDHDFAADGVVSNYKNNIREDRNGGSLSNLKANDFKNIDQIAAKEKDLLSQLEQLQKMKSTMR